MSRLRQEESRERKKIKGDYDKGLDYHNERKVGTSQSEGWQESRIQRHFSLPSGLFMSPESHPCPSNGRVLCSPLSLLQMEESQVRIQISLALSVCSCLHWTFMTQGCGSIKMASPRLRELAGSVKGEIPIVRGQWRL